MAKQATAVCNAPLEHWNLMDDLTCKKSEEGNRRLDTSFQVPFYTAV